MSIQYTAADFWNILTANNYSYTTSYKKKILESDENVETLQEDIVNLKKAVKNLRKYSENSTPRDKLEKQMNSLVETYNSVSSDADNVSSDELEKQLKKFRTLVSDNATLLKKVGITMSDGKLSFDSETFEDAADKTIKKLFDGKDSFVKQADKLMKKIEQSADDAQYSLVEHTLGSTTRYDTSTVELAGSIAYIKEAVKLLGELGTPSDDNRDDIETYLSAISSLYNVSRDGGYENFSKLQTLYDEYKEELETVGYTYAEDGGAMTYENAADYDNNFISAYLSLFDSSSEFYNSVINYCSEAFNSLLKTESLGISIVDAYA